MYHNGVQVPSSVTGALIPTTSSYMVMGVQALVSLATNDYIEIYAANLTNNDNIDIATFNLDVVANP